MIKNLLQPLAKSVLILLGLTAAGSEADADIYKYNYKIILNEEMEGIIKMKQNNKEMDFLVCYLGILGASWLGNILADKGFA